MKQFINILKLSLLFLIFSACENPLFIDAAQVYEVTFSTNGGTLIESYRTDCVKETPYTQKADCTFLGWHENSDFSDKAVVFPFELTKNTTLYAQWAQNYTVTFETNGGDKIASYKTGVITDAPDTSRTNYILDGWYTTSDFSGEKVNFPLTLTKPISLYAKWLSTYNVTFATNGGSEIPSYRTAEINTAPECSRDGYSFAGWYSDVGLSKTVTFPLTLIADTTLYAKWLEVHTVTFVTNGGTAVSKLVTGYIESSPVTTKNDFGFGGWYLDSEFATENKVNFPYTVTGDVTLYAKWTAVQCTVTYFANGATKGSVPVTVSVDKGSTYTVSGNTGNLEKSGYAFTKWNTRADGGGQGYSAGSKFTVTGDVSLYAQWGKNYAEMVTVPGGWFYLGDPSSSERPKITLSSFQIAKYELTYELWLEVYTWAKKNGYNLTAAKKGYSVNDQYKSFVPATNISWNMACVWLNAYSEYKGLEPVYYRGNIIWKDDTSTSGTFCWSKEKNGYRLPTEIEWEFAAGGGNNTIHDTCKFSGSNTISDVAWYDDNSNYEAHPVGTKKFNALEIYDMSGNVAEWCYDYYASFGSGELTNPVHEVSTSYDRVIIRGSCILTSYLNYATIYSRAGDKRDVTRDYCYANLNNYYASSISGILGIRIARNAQ